MIMARYGPKGECHTEDHVGPTISKSKEDEMVWESKSGTFMVRFTGDSPFEDKEFEEKPNAEIHMET